MDYLAKNESNIAACQLCHTEKDVGNIRIKMYISRKETNHVGQGTTMEVDICEECDDKLLNENDELLKYCDRCGMTFNTYDHHSQFRNYDCEGDKIGFLPFDFDLNLVTEDRSCISCKDQVTIYNTEEVEFDIFGSVKPICLDCENCEVHVTQKDYDIKVKESLKSTESQRESI